MRSIAVAAWVSLSFACSTSSTAIETTEQAVSATVAWTNPYDIAVDPYDNVYVVDSAWPCTLTKIGQDGSASTVARFTCSGSYGLAVDANGTAFVAQQRSILEITADGTVSTLAAANPNDTYPYPRTSTFGLIQPGMMLDASDNVYVVDMFNGGSRIRKITPAGVVSTSLGGGAALGWVDGSAITSSTSVFSTYENCIVDQLGSVVMYGQEYKSGNKDGSLNNALFNWPEGLAAAKNGDLYVADTQNNEIRKVHQGAVTTLAGAAGTPGWVDGIGSAARFNQPMRLAVDSANNVYVLEWGNGDTENPGNRAVRKITPAGVVTTFASPCGQGCAAGTVCEGNQCVACSGGTSACGGITCLDLTSDSASCGACGNVCGAWTGCISATCVSQFLDLDFGTSATTKTGPVNGWGNAGDRWNSVNTAASPASAPLFWADGTPAAGVTLTATNLQGAWAWTGEHPVDAMYASYNYSWSGSSASITVSGLPASDYDVAIWGKQGKNNTGFYVTVLDPTGATVYTSDTEYTGTVADVGTWTYGNQYVAFNLQLSAGETMVIDLLPGAQGAGNAGMIINGMQILRNE